MNLKGGVYKIPMEEYLNDPVCEPSLTRSTIKDLLFKSPLHAWANHSRLNPFYKEDNDKKFDIGTAAHDIFLEGLDRVCIVYEKDWKKKEAKEARDNARIEGKIPLLESQYHSVREMVMVAIKSLNESELSGLFDDGEPELTYVWNDGGAWCRCRLDKITKDREIILDYKSTGTSANPEDFIRIVLSHGYDIQEEFYRRGVKMIEGKEPKFVFMVQEIDPPYPCSFIGLSPEFQAMADQKVIRGLDVWKTCTSRNFWPGYPLSVCWIDPPPWALNWEMRATLIGNSMEEI